MGGTRDDIVKIAKSQLGIKENGKNNVKYNTWFYGKTVSGDNYPWCAAFVAWCANQAGVSTSVIPKTASVSELQYFFQKKGQYKAKNSGYRPQPGDIMIQKSNGASHTGIVVSSNSSSFTVIEGNASNKVAQKTYAYFQRYLSGFGVPNYGTSTSSSANKTTTANKTASATKTTKNSAVSTASTAAEVKEKEKKEITSTVIKSVSGNSGAVRKFVDVENKNAPAIELYIQNGNTIYQPLLTDGIKWETERAGTAGRLSFTVVKDETIAFHEGNTVILKVNGKNVFYGYVFTKSRDKNHHIAVTAYDQLRYLKNQHTYIYANKGVDDLIKMIAQDFNLRVGKLDSTGYKIPGRVEDNSTLFDVIQNAIDDTILNSGKMFILYDDFGALTLKNAANMRVATDYVVTAETAQNFDYETTIDEQTYNKILLYRDNEETGKREFYITQSGENISKWGVLQHTEQLNEGENPTTKGQSILATYNNVTRNLQINNAFGDLRVRAGASVCVALNLGDLVVNSYMFVEKCTHEFKNELHTMTLSLCGGSFLA